MNFSNLTLTATSLSAMAGAISLLGVVIWWIVRIRQKRIWLPTIRILRLDSPELPKVKMLPPPWVSFISFLLIAAVLAFFALRPKEKIFSPFEPKMTRIHIFVDMSPSVSSQLSLSNVAEKVKSLWGSLKNKGQITLSTSHGNEFIHVNSSEQLSQFVLMKGFHRGGVRLGSAVKKMMQELGDVDRLFVASDRDLHSWGDFNWKYLIDDMDVRFIDFSVQGVDQQLNVFIDKAKFLSAPSSSTMDWEISIASQKREEKIEGVLNVVYQGSSVFRLPWTIPSGTSNITVRASWPKSKVLQDRKKQDDRTPLVWKLESIDGDRLSLDNLFRTSLKGLGKPALLIGEANGERALEDFSFQLGVILEVTGIRVKRVDQIKQPGPNAEAYPFWAVVGGSNGIESFCPRSLTDYRLAASDKMSTQLGGLDATLAARTPPKVWLLPTQVNANYSDLCWCYHRILKAESVFGEKPLFCKDVTDRNSYIRVMSSLGAKQVGGQLGDEENSIAWIGKDQASGVEVTAFTIPLRPSARTGLSHARLPLLVKQLLQWSGVIKHKVNSDEWPRISDLSEEVWSSGPVVQESRENKGLSGQTLAGFNREMARLTNVPVGESHMEVLKLSELPPQWGSDIDLAKSQMPMKQKSEDPIPWLILCAAIIIFAMIFEAVWMISMGLLKGMYRKKKSAVVLLALIFGSMSESSYAEVVVNVVGGSSPQMTLVNLSREVSQRTSLNLSPQIKFIEKNSDQMLEQPWLWVNSLAGLVQPSGELKPELVYWIKRGGFLVVQRQPNNHALQKLTSKGFDEQVTGGRWGAIPPDHVLMRSFYLLDSLPGCQGGVWSGFQFDGRLAILSIPYDFIGLLSNKNIQAKCKTPIVLEHSIRRFVNLLMVSLATDYKKDQIHLPEILKRLR